MEKRKSIKDFLTGVENLWGGDHPYSIFYRKIISDKKLMPIK
jgi:hypothetical protein